MSKNDQLIYILTKHICSALFPVLSLTDASIPALSKYSQKIGKDKRVILQVTVDPNQAFELHLKKTILKDIY